MSVNKLGGELTPYVKTTSIFEGHPNANLATIGKVGVVHSGNLQIGVYTTLYEAHADGVKVGQLYGIGKLHPTGLLPDPDGPKPEFPGEEIEHTPEMIEEVKAIEEVEPKEGEPGKEEEAIVIVGEEEIPGAEPFVVAEDCELVVYEIRIFTGYELRLCEAKTAVTTLASLMADSSAKSESLSKVMESLQDQLKQLSQLDKQYNAEIEAAKTELKEREETYEEMTSACAKASAEGPAGNEACQNLADFIAKGNLDEIAILKARIAELEALLAANQSEYKALNDQFNSLEDELVKLKKAVQDYENAGVVQAKAVTEAEDAYASLGTGVAPSIGQLNSLAVGKTSISSTCVDGEGECCPLPDGPAGEAAIFNLQFLAKLMAEGGEGPPPAEA